jgi:hypothetical protein
MENKPEEVFGTSCVAEKLEISEQDVKHLLEAKKLRCAICDISLCGENIALIELENREQYFVCAECIRRGPRRYNCARVYVGGYVGGGTNEFERWLECNYELLVGDITIKKLRPIRVRGTNSECTISTLNTLVLYPKSSIAIVKISNGKRHFLIQLVKRSSPRSTIFKLRL